MFHGATLLATWAQYILTALPVPARPLRSSASTVSSSSTIEIASLRLLASSSVFYFLSTPQAFRIAPPLNINDVDLNEALDTLIACIEQAHA